MSKAADYARILLSLRDRLQHLLVHLQHLREKGDCATIQGLSSWSRRMMRAMGCQTLDHMSMLRRVQGYGLHDRPVTEVAHPVQS